MEALAGEQAGRLRRPRPAGPDAAGGAPASGGSLVFVGFMGAGKSTAARAVVAELRVEPVDSDRELERQLGSPIEDFFEREGEPRFREREEAVVLELLERPDAPVVALGGGALGSERVRQALQRHTVVHLEIEPEEAWARASGRGRPLARDREAFERLHSERRALYDSAADAVIPAADPGVVARALPALRSLGEERASGARLIWATAASGDYPVFFGRGLLSRGFLHPPGGRRFLVTDRNVAAHLSLEADWRTELPPGETQKTLGRVEEVLREMARAGVTREDLVVALGGGVVGDLAGFCAAVYQRGVRHVQVPTTLVAQVDSAYGGKTGVDLPEGKNYVGAFHQPAAVLVDPAALETLPQRERSAGFAEVLKTALIAGGELWERVRGGGSPDEQVVLSCIRTKLAVVAGDERDAGRRQVLNLGHTVAHALEAATGYRHLRHGEAVGLGLLCALRISGREDLRAEVAALLSQHGLPTSFRGPPADEVAGFLARDKKRRGGRVPFVLVEAPGRVTPGHDVAEQDLVGAIEEIRAS